MTIAHLKDSCVRLVWYVDRLILMDDELRFNCRNSVKRGGCHLLDVLWTRKMCFCTGYKSSMENFKKTKRLEMQLPNKFFFFWKKKNGFTLRKLSFLLFCLLQVFWAHGKSLYCGYLLIRHYIYLWAPTVQNNN